MNGLQSTLEIGRVDGQVTGSASQPTQSPKTADSKSACKIGVDSVNLAWTSLRLLLLLLPFFRFSRRCQR